MRPLYSVFGLLLLVTSVFSSIDMGEYLYSNEDISSVTSEQLLTSTPHLLYYVDGEETLISSQNQVLEQKQEIKQVLLEHYSNNFLPSDSQIDDLRNDILKFNESRNYESRFGPVEDICLQYTGLQMHPCDDLESCHATANLICSLSSASGCYPEVLAPLILEYSNQVSVFNTHVPIVVDSIGDLSSSSDPSSKISDALDSINKIKSAATAIENSELRFPENEYCGDCYGLCPDAHFDKDSLNSLSSKLSSTSSSFSELNKVDAISSSIFESTEARINYKKGSMLLEVWEPKWIAFKQENDELYSEALEISEYVSDSEFRAPFSRFNDAWESMDSRVSSLDFDGVDEDMDTLQSSAKVLEDYINSDEPRQYEIAFQVSNEASDSIIYAKYNVRNDDPSSVEAYNSLAARKNQLDSKFSPPMTSTKYEQMALEYQTLASDSQTFIQSQAHLGEAVWSAGGAFGQTSIDAVFSLTDALYTLPPSQKETVAPAIPAVVLFLFDLAAVSVLLVLFVGIAVKYKYIFKRRAILGAWVSLLLTFLFILGIGSVAMFILIDQSAQSGNLQDFVGVLSNANSVYVLADKTDAPQSAATAMFLCAQNISGQVKAHYDTQNVGVFEISGSNCNYAGQQMSADECLNIAGSNPTFHLNYAQQPQSKFFVVYQKRAELAGNSAYFERCDIGDVLD